MGKRTVTVKQLPYENQYIMAILVFGEFQWLSGSFCFS